MEDISLANLEKLEHVPIGLQIEGGEEIKIGLKTFEELDIIFENIEE